ncbi:MAG TPA: DUF192 domain-containing protein [Rhodocyclaceae bacterium]|nr:MAG: hypothetical protein AUK49_14100 [Betaproteobacteria bacterium CG2_30_68_42]PIV72552.1 MAG: hypothetical protein COW56_08445 [Rhodocyclales bacterium CG17_big_fil_post_rev_8_21_14_2_50_68_7]PIX76262.1 MAG: hypothetical protein COZ38_01225 [Rhodocyclales bacterium CG_4_10_14_3_um_filter_68_10]PJA56385.1 MAG: hypothetical protein CO164_13355 [Rhodocyclales bacterium CG_4_9_14_3_um_filter_68_10]HCX34554.1 DUF192 domain-containing protein [Rhodocyclaceae bacterium]
MKWARAAAGTLLFAWMSVAGAQAKIELSAGIHRIEAEVAADFDTRARGLMHRQTMSAQAGMLFVFPETGRHCMWMRNTRLPLSVAFVDGGGRILNIEDMEPLTETSHCATAPARYALEMNKGWFAQRGIRAGAMLRGLERAPAPR